MGKAMRSFRSLGMAMILGIAPAGAHAACLNPGGSGGDVIYNSAVQVMQYCNDANWIAMGASSLILPSDISGLVHHWKLEENGSGPFADDAGSADCTVTSGTMVSVPGKDGNAINHTGDSSNCGMISELSNATQFTLSGWVRKETTGGSVYLGIADEDDSSVEIFMGNDGYVYWDVNSDDAGWEEAYYPLNDTVWHHYAMVFDGTQADNDTRLKAYIDGEQVDLDFSGTIPAVSPVLTEEFSLANSVFGDGYVDDVRIYDRPLTAKEVRSLYWGTGAASGGMPPVNHWSFDENAGSTVTDDSSGVTASFTNMDSSNWVPGKFGSALDFDGSTEYLDVTDDDSLSYEDTNYSWTFWIYPRSLTTANSYVSYYDDSIIVAVGDNQLGLSGSNTVFLYMQAGGGTYIYAAGNNNLLTLNAWNHVAIVLDRTLPYENEVKIYVNGVEGKNTEYQTGYYSYNDPADTQIGQFNGILDEYATYTRALTEGEVQALASGTVATVDGSPACANPFGWAGAILYNQTHSVMQFCNGVQWVAMSNATVTDPCASGSVTSGTVCNSGRVYVGTTPDGSVPMYTTRCGQGQTWNGTSCTGTLSGIQWNNGSGTGTDTTADSATDGDGNTAALLASGDSNAPYAAAQACAGLGSEWYLPALDELDLLNDNNANGALSGTFAGAGSGYWSSTEDDSDLAFRQFIPGSQSSSGKYQSRAVRCVSKSMGVGTCNSPSGNGGDMIYNTGTNTMQYCNGSGWVKVGK